MEFGNPIVGSETLIRESIQSPDYVAGVSGWRLGRDGNVEINNLIARGDITASNVDVQFGTGEAEAHISIEPNDVISRIAFDFPNDVDLATRGAVGALLFDNPPNSKLAELFLDAPGLNGLQSASLNLQGERIDAPPRWLFATGVPPSQQTGIVRLSTGISLESEMMRHKFVTSSDNIVCTNTAFEETDTDIRITMPAPISGIVTVYISHTSTNTTTANAWVGMSYEIRENDALGAVLVPATTLRIAAQSHATINERIWAHWHQTHDALPTTGNLFIRAMYSVEAGSGTYVDRTMTVIPSP